MYIQLGINIVSYRIVSYRIVSYRTTNLAEGWMSIRCKFYGGKQYNRCHRGSWHARCHGAGLRSSIGAMWSPVAWKKVTGRVPYASCSTYYSKQERRRQVEKKCKTKPEQRLKRQKGKYQCVVDYHKKKAKLSYGEQALIVEDSGG